MKHIVRISILLSISFCFQGCGQISPEQDNGQNGFLRTSKTQTSSGELGFSMTTTTKDGVTVHSMAEPNMLTFLMEGNIVPDRWLPMMGFYIHSEELTQEQKEATLQLLASSGNFVTPKDIQLKNWGRSGRVKIRFDFMGEDDGSRRIELNAQLKDAEGNSLLTINRICLGMYEFQHGKIHVFGGNNENFKFNPGLIKDVKQISITLKEL